MSNANMPTRCPSCGGSLQIERLHCAACGTDVQGQFRPCPVCALGADARSLFELFLAARGNLKDVQRALGISYPTVRQRIEELFAELEASEPAPEPRDILARLRQGELTAKEAEELLRASASGRVK
jgi:hypothetical protein